MRREFTLTLVALALLALTACSVETEVTPPNPSQGNAISFDSVSTRAGLSDIQADGFGVWGVHFNSAQQYGYLLLDKQDVTYDGSKWVYSPVKYWLPNTVFNFVAAYPAERFETAVYTEGDVSLNYIVLNDFNTADQSNVEDILGATAVVDTSVEGYTKTVPLTFNHLLCRINVCLMQDGDQNREDNFIIDKVTLSGVKTTGNYYYFPLSNEVSCGWGVDANATTTFEREFTDNANIGLSGERYLDDDGLLLLPQAITAETIKLTVNFRFGAQGTEDISLYEPKTLEAYLPATEDLWQSGKSITYNVKVSTYNPITFLPPTVSPWGNLQSGGTIIIK